MILVAFSTPALLSVSSPSVRAIILNKTLGYYCLKLTNYSLAYIKASNKAVLPRGLALFTNSLN